MFRHIGPDGLIDQLLNGPQVEDLADNRGCLYDDPFFVCEQVQASSQKSLDLGTTLADCIELVRRFKQADAEAEVIVITGQGNIPRAVDALKAGAFDFLEKPIDQERLLDKLLICALIEARSCERFKRLSEGLPDEYLRNFYRRFMESEAGHYRLFIELSETYVEKEKVRTRWQQWLAYEADVMKNMEVRGDRMH